jgi:hypothetical protein
MFRGSPWIIGLVLAGIIFIAAYDRFKRSARRKNLARLGAALLALGSGLAIPALSDGSAATVSFVAAFVALATGAVVLGFAHRGGPTSG